MEMGKREGKNGDRKEGGRKMRWARGREREKGDENRGREEGIEKRRKGGGKNGYGDWR
jgi:hypothetical protein